MFWATGPGHSQWLHVVRAGMVGHIVVQLVGSNEWGGELQCPYEASYRKNRHQVWDKQAGLVREEGRGWEY